MNPLEITPRSHLLQRLSSSLWLPICSYLFLSIPARQSLSAPHLSSLSPSFTASITTSVSIILESSFFYGLVFLVLAILFRHRSLPTPSSRSVPLFVVSCLLSNDKEPVYRMFLAILSESALLICTRIGRGFLLW